MLSFFLGKIMYENAFQNYKNVNVGTRIFEFLYIFLNSTELQQEFISISSRTHHTLVDGTTIMAVENVEMVFFGISSRKLRAFL